MQRLTIHPHPNVLGLLHHTTEHRPGARARLHLVLEYFPLSLAKQIQHWAVHDGSDETAVNLYTYQLTRALAHLHGLDICHRDIKPDNVLINPNNNVLKLCDFGSAKTMHRGSSSTSYIATRYYRAPECLLGNSRYGTAIDIWALGCCFAEMLSCRTLFCGNDQPGQLCLMLKMRGKPKLNEFQELNPDLDLHSAAQMTAKIPSRPRPWAHVLCLPRLSPSASSLLDALLAWSPAGRSTALSALHSSHFDSIRALKPQQQECIGCELFDFTEFELRDSPDRPAPGGRVRALQP